MSYYMVHMGQLDHLNGPGSYAFPTARAAEFFALNHKRRDPNRAIRVEYPDGITKDVPLTPGAFYRRDFVAEMENGTPRYGNPTVEAIIDTLVGYASLRNGS